MPYQNNHFPSLLYDFDKKEYIQYFTKAKDETSKLCIPSGVSNLLFA